MHFLIITALLGTLTVVASTAIILTRPLYPNSSVDNPYSEAQGYLLGLQLNYLVQTRKALLQTGSSKCNSNNIAIRRAWDDLDEDSRAAYIKAVYCMTSLPTRMNLTEVPGARNWLDDYTWQHIANSNYIHFSAYLLPWHRQFIWAWEQDLRNQCGYSGYLPYWPWERHADNQSASPVFGSSNTSFGTNGIYVEHGVTTVGPIGITGISGIAREPGTGGGDVVDGAFGCNTDYRINLGPVTGSNNSFTGESQYNNTFGQQYNPRCIVRDFYQPPSSQLLNYTNIAELMAMDNIHDFHNYMETQIHGAGHSFLGGDGDDFYASPQEPLFWLHHGNLDRLWAIWQAQNLASRGDALDGTLTYMNTPPTENATLDSILHMGIPAGGEIPIRNVMVTTDYDYCYMYV